MSVVATPSQSQRQEQAEEVPEEIASQDDVTPPPSPRITRARAHGTPHSTSARQQSTQSNFNATMHRGPNTAATRAQKSPHAPEMKESSPDDEYAVDEETEEDDGDYVHVNVGDCVLLDSGDPDENFIALVSAVQPSQNRAKAGMFTAQWYYKPDDIKESVLRTIPNGLLPNEVFLSPHKDKNSMDAVIDTCQVVSPGEYEEIQHEIARGFREKSSKLFFVCRYKYWPSRQGKRALEELKHNEVRSGLGRPTPNVGNEFQAEIPEMSPALSKLFYETGPRRIQAATGSPSTTAKSRSVMPSPPIESPGMTRFFHQPREFKYRHVWSPEVAWFEEAGLRRFRELLDPIKYACGNILKTFRYDEQKAPLRCIIVRSEPLEICTSKGVVQRAQKSELNSPLTDDFVLDCFVSSKFNIAVAIEECAHRINAVREQERLAFKQEVKQFAQLRANQRVAQHCVVTKPNGTINDDEGSDRKRRK